MSKPKSVPTSRATRDLHMLIPKLAGRLREQDIADIECSARRMGSRLACQRAMCQVPNGSPEEGYGDFPNISEYFWMSRWAACKHVYRVDSTVAKELMDQPFEGALPTAVFGQLPYPIVYVDNPTNYSYIAFDGSVQCGICEGFLAYLDAHPLTGREQLCLVSFYRDPDCFGHRRHIDMLDVGMPTLDDAVDEILDADTRVFRDEYGFPEDAVKARGEILRNTYIDSLKSMLNLLLYVIAEERDARVIHDPTAISEVKERRPRKANPETIVELGAQMGRKLGAARRAVSEKYDSDTAPSRTTAPHIRRGHWHCYWVGPRKGRSDGRPGDKLIVKWISPIEVGGSAGSVEKVHEGGRPLGERYRAYR